MTSSSPADTLPRDAWQKQPTLDQLTKHDIWSMRRAFLEWLWPDAKGMSVLEVGSGPAHDSLTFAQRGAHVTAVDCSHVGLDLAQEIYTGLGLPLETMQADATDLPFDRGEFDLAFNGGVLEHFTDDQLETVIDEMIRTVKPSGYVLAFCPNRYNIFYQANLRRAREHAYDYERAFTASEIRKRFESRGLIDVRVSGVHVHPAPNYLLPTWLPKHHLIEPACRWAFAWFERLHAFHRLKSLIGQDFVVWGRVPTTITTRRPLVQLGGGPPAALHHARPVRKAA